MQVEEIKKLIESGLPDSQVDVNTDDGTHFSTIVISKEFAGKSVVQQHQLVYKALGSKIGNEIHALAIKTFTPEQWEKQKDLRVI